MTRGAAWMLRSEAIKGDVPACVSRRSPRIAPAATPGESDEHERHSRLRSPGAAHVRDESCFRHMAHPRLILGCPAHLGPAARGYPARGHDHTGGQTTPCSPDT